jgi:hypothetical protein
MRSEVRVWMRMELLKGLPMVEFLQTAVEKE